MSLQPFSTASRSNHSKDWVLGSRALGSRALGSSAALDSSEVLGKDRSSKDRDRSSSLSKQEL